MAWYHDLCQLKLENLPTGLGTNLSCKQDHMMSFISECRETQPKTHSALFKL